MDYEKLYEPYSTDEAPAVVDQLKWIRKKGLPDNIIEQAMLKVFDEMWRGLTFEATKDHSATWAFSRYLLNVATRLHRDEAALKIDNLQEFHNKLKIQTTFDVTEAHKKELFEHTSRLEALNERVLKHIEKVEEYEGKIEELNKLNRELNRQIIELNQRLGEQLQIEAGWNALSKTKKVLEVVKGNA